MDTNGGTYFEVRAMIGEARAAFVVLNKIWKSRETSIPTKLRTFNSNVALPMGMYGSETLRTIKFMLQQIQTVESKCLRRILRIWWPETITNETL